jgi:hypothetical protein
MSRDGLAVSLAALHSSRSALGFLVHDWKSSLPGNEIRSQPLQVVALHLGLHLKSFPFEALATAIQGELRNGSALEQLTPRLLAGWGAILHGARSRQIRNPRMGSCAALR